MALSIEYEIAPTKITNHDNFICTMKLIINTNSVSAPDELAHKGRVLCKKFSCDTVGNKKATVWFLWCIIGCLLSVASHVISSFYDNKSIPATCNIIMLHSCNTIF